MKPAHLPLLAGLLLAPAITCGATADELLERYRAEGAGPFSAAAGEQLWLSSHSLEGEQRRCASCHGDDLRAAGKHERTGKRIEPIAPSANPERLSDARKVEKWLLRNCKWTFGRPCSAQEKGDLISYLKEQ